MKTKSINRVIAFVTALFLLLTCFAFSPIVNTRAHAAGSTYVLEASELDNVQDKGVIKDGETRTAGTDKYFTVYCGADARFDKSEKPFDDGYTGAQRINFNGGADATTPKNVVGFTTSAAATIKVWWAKNGDDERQIAVFDASGNQVDATTGTVEKNAAAISTLKVDKAGKYYIGGTPKSNYLFKIEVTEEAAAQTFELDSTANLASFNQGDKADGESEKAGTDGFFTVYYSAKTKIDKSEKTFDDGYTASQRINFGGAGDAATPKNVVGFTVGSAAEVTLWWVSNGDDRQMAIFDKDGKTVDITEGVHTKNSFFIDKFTIPAAGTYYLGATNGGNYIFKIQVVAGAAKVERGDWSKVAAPVIASAKDDGAGNMIVTVTADVSDNGGDAVAVTMTDSNGNAVDTKRSSATKTSHELTFTPDASDDYTFKATLSRDGETDKTSAEVKASFTLPLGKPAITSATSKGNGSVKVVWTPVDEATGYNVYYGSTKAGTAKADETTFTVTGLTVGQKYDFTVEAVRDTEVGAKSDKKTTEATKDAQTEWGFIRYGTSTDDKNNYVEGDLNEDGKITIASTGGKGKFQEGSNDGVAFYYTSIPSSKNFTIRAKVHVDEWTLSSGQEGVGIMAIDSLPGNGYGTPNSTDLFWSNSYRVGIQRFAYWYDKEAGVNTAAEKIGDKYQMNIGVGIQTKLGMTKANIDDVYKSANGIVEFGEYALETLAADKGLGAGTYATIGNCTNPATFKSPAVAELTDFILELTRNNTGYFLSYYTPDGKLVRTQKFYDPKALDQLDPDNVYVGFAAARNMKATISDVTLTTIDPKDDKPAEAKPATKITPKVTVGSSNVANSDKYPLLVKANVKGSADVIVGGKTVATVSIDGTDEYAKTIVPISAGTNKVEVKFTPDAKQALPENTVLSSTAPITSTITVKYDTYLAKQSNLYVAPNGTKGGNGSKAHPLDIYTAVNLVRAGQTIILMEGTYNLTSSVSIERGINGTAENAVKMIADLEAKTRPVLDFGANANVKTAGLLAAGDYWYFSGFDVARRCPRRYGIGQQLHVRQHKVLYKRRLRYLYPL